MKWLVDSQEDILHNVDRIREKSKEYLSGPVYERIEKLPNISASIIDMYASFGQLFLYGQLGACDTELVSASSHKCSEGSDPV